MSKSFLNAFGAISTRSPYSLFDFFSLSVLSFTVMYEIDSASCSLFSSLMMLSGSLTNPPCDLMFPIASNFRRAIFVVACFPDVSSIMCRFALMFFPASTSRLNSTIFLLSSLNSTWRYSEGDEYGLGVFEPSFFAWISLNRIICSKRSSRFNPFGFSWKVFNPSLIFLLYPESSLLKISFCPSTFVALFPSQFLSRWSGFSSAHSTQIRIFCKSFIGMLWCFFNSFKHLTVHPPFVFTML